MRNNYVDFVEEVGGTPRTGKPLPTSVFNVSRITKSCESSKDFERKMADQQVCRQQGQKCFLDEVSRMENRQGSRERRAQKRFPVNGYLMVAGNVFGGPIKDISAGGFAFYTAQAEKCVTETSIDSGTIIGDDFYLTGLPIECISESVSEHGRYSIKRHGVKFGPLTSAQLLQLDDFIGRSSRRTVN